jgi:hypothetical protein
MKMIFYWQIIHNNIILMIDNDQSTIIEAPEGHKSIPTHCPHYQRQVKRKVPSQFWHLRWTCYGQFYWTNFQDIIFTLSTVSLVTQKQLTFLGWTPYLWIPSTKLSVNIRAGKDTRDISLQFGHGTQTFKWLANVAAFCFVHIVNRHKTMSSLPLSTELLPKKCTLKTVHFFTHLTLSRIICLMDKRWLWSCTLHLSLVRQS